MELVLMMADMEWIEERIRKPENQEVVHVICVGPEHDKSWDMERTLAQFVCGEWVVLPEATLRRVVLWLESSRPLSDEEALAVPLPNIAHFPRA